MRVQAGRKIQVQVQNMQCEGCGSLLGKLEGGGFTIRRGALQVTIHGQFHASVVCYRPQCKRLNVLQLAT